MKTIKFAPIKGDEDKTTLILDEYNHVIGYYDYSWSRLGGMMYRYGHAGHGMISKTTRSAIEAAITRRLTGAIDK
jgi:hypothetical protein